MKPILQKIDFYGLPASSIKKICPCKKPCTEGVTVTFLNDGTILCFNEARGFMYDLIKKLDTGGYTTWSANDEAYLVEKFKEQGMFPGFNREASIALGKTYAQVKGKVTRMRNAGIF